VGGIRTVTTAESSRSSPSNAKILMWFSAVCIASGAKRRAMLFLIQLEATSKWAPPVTGLHVKQELDLL